MICQNVVLGIWISLLVGTRSDKDPHFFNPDSCTDFFKHFAVRHVVFWRACLDEEVRQHTRQSLFHDPGICRCFLKRRDAPVLNIMIGILQKSQIILEFLQKKI